MPTTTLPARRSPRLRGYDYTRSGFYFVTVATHDRRCLFGEIISAEMRANDAGRMIAGAWTEIPGHYPGVSVDTFVLMPDHVHGIVQLFESSDSAHALSLSDVMHRFKTLTTTRYIDGVNALGWPAFQKHLWARSYYEHVVRNEASLARIRAYIVENPVRWHERLSR
jgi:REP element-mobilizing transposase RayT